MTFLGREPACRGAYIPISSGIPWWVALFVPGGIIGRGGTMLSTARCPEFHGPKGRKEALRTLNRFGIEGLVVIGGNGSLSGALALWRMGFPIIGILSFLESTKYRPFFVPLQNL